MAECGSAFTAGIIGLSDHDKRVGANEPTLIHYPTPIEQERSSSPAQYNLTCLCLECMRGTSWRSNCAFSMVVSSKEAASTPIYAVQESSLHKGGTPTMQQFRLRALPVYGLNCCVGERRSTSSGGLPQDYCSSGHSNRRTMLIGWFSA